jgi:hypothetical protein
VASVDRIGENTRRILPAVGDGGLPLHSSSNLTVAVFFETRGFAVFYDLEDKLLVLEVPLDEYVRNGIREHF